MIKKFTLTILVSLFLFSSSCKKENDPQPSNNTPTTPVTPHPCDTANVSYAAKITGIMSHCTGCHNGGSQNFTNYNSIKNWLDNGNNKNLIILAVEHKPGADPMPQNAAKLDSCSILQLKAWINQGYKNN